MKSFPKTVVLVAFLLLSTSCTSLPLFQKGTPQKPIPPPPDIQAQVPTENTSELKEAYHPLLLAAAAVFFLWAMYRSIRSAKSRKRIILNDEDMLHLAHVSETISDFIYRIRSKARKKIIPFPRGN